MEEFLVRLWYVVVYVDFCSRDDDGVYLSEVDAPSLRNNRPQEPFSHCIFSYIMSIDGHHVVYMCDSNYFPREAFWFRSRTC
jgi:hypothetical protein